MNVLEKILGEIEELKRNQDSKNQDFVTGYISALSTVEGVIAGLDEAKDINVPSNDGWIPVEERLPEKREELLYDMQLVTLGNGEVCLGVYRNQENEWWTRRQEGEKSYTTAHKVVAWQPLPEPYKPKKSKKSARIHNRNWKIFGMISKGD